MKIKLILFFLLTLKVSSCTKNDMTKEIGEEMYLSFEDKDFINDNGNQTEIEFINLVEDSSCPEGSQCIWAGRIVVELRMNHKDILTLGIGDLQTGVSPPYLSSIEYGNYIISLVSVNYLNKENQGKEEKYRIKIRVERK